MRKLITQIVSSLVLSTVLISSFNTGMVLNASNENINLLECYANGTEKNTIDSQIQSFSYDTSFIVNSCDLDNSYKIYSVGSIDKNTTDFQSCISSNCKIEDPFINENGIEFVGIKFGENTFPSISEIYSLIDNYFPNTYIDEVKFIDLKQYGKMCIYVSANEKQYLIDITNNDNTIYTAQEFISSLDLYKDNQSNRAIYVGRNVSK